MLNPDRVRPEMVKVYRGNPSFKAEDFLPGTVVSIDNGNASIGVKCTLVVDVSTSSPDHPRWTYLLVRTPEGFKVDWEASQAQSKKEYEAIVQAKMRELNPVVEIEVLRWYESGSYACAEFRLTNKSKALFPFVAVEMEIHNAKGDYLGNDDTNETNVRTGQSVVKEFNFNNVKVGEVASWKLTLKDVRIDQGGGRKADATEFFSLKETLAGADRGYQKRLESVLSGHWRESRKIELFTEKGDYFFSFATSEAIRVDAGGKQLGLSIEVIERNYSSGKVTLRLLNPDIGVRFELSLVDDKTVRAQVTEVSLEGGRFREVREEARPKFASEWTYIDKKERP